MVNNVHFGGSKQKHATPLEPGKTVINNLLYIQ
jgi:hypothetical protein